MDYKEYWESIERRRKEMDDEFVRVACIMDEHGYECAPYVDYDYAKQWVKVEMPPAENGQIYSWYFAVKNRDHFKDVLKWLVGKTKFYGVTAFAEDRKRIPTFYSVKDVDMYYAEYFG